MWGFGKNNERKWQCFCCGMQFTAADEFKNHVIEKHDEGRDYIICPLKRCSFPVRCLRSHFKAKHKGDEIPKKGQMKAMIWKDHKNPNERKGKVKTRKPKFREGYMTSLKNNKEIHYRSGTECQVYECLEAIPEVVKYDAEPIKIPYLFDGEKHNYFPDLSVFFSNGKIEIWEVKPQDQTWLPVNKAKWEAAKHFCETRGWKFIVITEMELEKLKKKIRNSQRL